MLRPCRNLGIALMVAAALLLPAWQSAAQTAPGPPASSAQKTKGMAMKPAPAAAKPAPSPPTLEQQPPTPPQVTYRDGQLSITSTNATLAQVLSSVQTQTGATIDLPPGTGNERVVATLGPGKPQTVLASLLNGSKFNYVIIGVSGNPDAVQKVLLLSKSNTSGGEAPVSTAQNNLRPQPQQAVEPPEDEYPQNEPEVENQNLVQPGMPGTPGADNVSPDAVQPGARTPEQMLQELQRMQQQQQQMQQQLNPSNQQPFGQPINPPNQQQPIPGQPVPQPQ